MKRHSNARFGHYARASRYVERMKVTYRVAELDCRAEKLLLIKLLSHPQEELAITIITIEEQLRGRWGAIWRYSLYRLR